MHHSIYQKIEDEGKLNKIYFQFNKIKKTPNSLSFASQAFSFCP